MSKTPANELSPEDTKKIQKTQNLVNDIFKDIEDNREVPATLIGKINNLRPSYLKFALSTPNLFAYESHGARLFLQRVVELSIQWKTIEDLHDNFLKKLDNIISKIIDLEEFNKIKFIGFEKELEKYLTKRQKLAKLKKKRQLEKEKGQQKISKAKLETSIIIDEKLSVLSLVPEFIKQILHNEWTSVLVLLNIRSGVESDSYLSNLRFIDLLIEVIVENKSLDNHEKKYKTLFEKYQEGLSLVAFNKQEIDEKKDQLVWFLKSIRQSQTLETPKEMPKEIPKEKTSNNQDENTKNNPGLEIQQEKQNPVVNKQQDTPEKNNSDNIDYEEMLVSLKCGSWLEIIEQNKTITAKISWVNPVTGSHLFVDSQGLKVATKTRDELINQLRNKTIKII